MTEAIYMELYLCIMAGLGFAAVLKLTLRCTAGQAAVYMLVATVGDLVTWGAYQWASVSVILILLGVYIKCVQRQRWSETLYALCIAAVSYLASVLSAASPVWMLSADLYATTLYNLIVSVLQLLVMILMGWGFCWAVPARMPKSIQIGTVIASMSYVAIESWLYPHIAMAWADRFSPYLRWFSIAHGFLSAGAVTAGVLLVRYLILQYNAIIFRTKQFQKLSKATKGYFDREHIRRGRDKIIQGYVEQHDWQNLTSYFQKYHEKPLADSAKLNHIKPEMVQSLLRHYVRQAQKEEIRFSLAADWIEEFKIDELDLCDALNIYLQNAFEHCKQMRDSGLSPEIELHVIEEPLFGARIILSNTVADTGAAWQAIRDMHKPKTSGHGYGLALGSEILARHDAQVTLTARDERFTIEIEIWNHEPSVRKEGFLERLAHRHTLITMGANAEQTSAKFIETEQKLKYLYYNIVKFVPFFLIACFLHVLPEAVFVIVIFGPVGSQAMGVHMDNDWACFLYSIAGYFVAIYAMIYLPLTWYAILIISAALVPIYWKYAPCGHPGRPILQRERLIRKKNSVFLVVSYCAAGLVLSLLPPIALQVRIGIWCAGMLIGIGVFIRKRKIQQPEFKLLCSVSLLVLLIIRPAIWSSGLVYVCCVEAVNLLPVTYYLSHTKRCR